MVSFYHASLLFKWSKQMNFLKGSVVFAFLLGIGISTIFGVKNLGNAQTQVSEPIIGQMPPTTKSPIGNNVGLEELTALFKTSEATKAKPIRKVVITIPGEMSDIYRRRVAANTELKRIWLFPSN